MGNAMLRKLIVSAIMASLWLPLTARAQAGPPAEVIAALTAAYGRYDPARRCWQASARDESGVTQGCLGLRRADPVQASDGKRIYVLLNGPGTTDCHACGGLIAFAVFNVDAAPRLLARSAALRDGGYGAPTPAKMVSVQKLGGDDWGWVEQAGSSGQGVTEEVFFIWLQRGNKVVQAGTLTGSHDDNGSECGVTPHPADLDCYDIKVSYRVDASDPAAAHYPIGLQIGGTKNGRRINQQARSTFDAATYAYVQPSGLP